MLFSRFRISKKTRATLGGILIALASLYALTEAYDISRASLLSFLFGSVVLVVTTMLMAIVLVFIGRKLFGLFRRLTGKDKNPD